MYSTLNMMCEKFSVSFLITRAVWYNNLYLSVSLQELDSLAYLADPRFSPYQGHNAFREKYFSGVNKRSGKEDNKAAVNGE